MMTLNIKSDFTILDKGERALMPAVDKSLVQSVESITNRIRYNWSPSSPSSPGNPPAVVTGNLDGSISFDHTGRDALGRFASAENATAIYLRIEAEYAAALEFGDPSKNLAPRPFLAPAVLAEQDEIGDKFKINFNGVWK